MIKEFKESYNYFQHGIGREPDTNNIGGSFGRAAAGLLRMFTCKLFKLADLDEGLAIRIVEDYMIILFKLFLAWIPVAIIVYSPDLMDEDFKSVQGIIALFLLPWMVSFIDSVEVSYYKKGEFKIYNRTREERTKSVFKWVGILLFASLIIYIVK